jgi:site-specific recombinase XerD
MTKYRFTVLGDVPTEFQKVSYEERLGDHEAVLRAYLRAFEKRAYTEKTTKRADEFLRSVFERILVQDASRGPGQTHLLVWDLLHPTLGPDVVDLIATSLNKFEYSHSTRMGYLGQIRRFCDFIMKRPYIPGRTPVAIVEKYGAPSQPVSTYECPTHSIDDPPVDPALIGGELKQFLDFVRVYYVSQNQKKHVAQRNYALIALAVTSGVRANELVHLDLDDLQYEKEQVLVRFGKGHKGSGKRQRLTIFPPFAQLTMQVYITHVRPQLGQPDTANRALFLCEGGNRITYDSMRAALDSIVELARDASMELPNPFTWHDSRRSFATGTLDARPQDILKVRGYLGHTGLGTLHRYVRPGRKALQKATNFLIARALPKKPPTKK